MCVCACVLVRACAFACAFMILFAFEHMRACFVGCNKRSNKMSGVVLHYFSLKLCFVLLTCRDRAAVFKNTKLLAQNTFCVISFPLASEVVPRMCTQWLNTKLLAQNTFRVISFLLASEVVPHMCMQWLNT